MPTDLQEYRDKLQAAADLADQELNETANGFKGQGEKPASQQGDAENKDGSDESN